MLQPLLRAVSQLDDPRFVGVVWASLVWSLLAFLVLLGSSVWLLEHWVGHGGWLGWLAGALGGLGVMLLAVWLFVPVALVIAAFYIDRVAEAVERRFYPGVAPPTGAGWAEQGWDGVVLGLQVLGLQVLALLASLALPGVGVVLGYAVTGWGIGRGLFVAVAMRRTTRPQALRLYATRRLQVIVPGIALAVLSTLPPFNLLVPVIGIAAMVHVLFRD